MRSLKVTVAISKDSEGSSFTSRYDRIDLLDLELPIPGDVEDPTLAQIAAKIGKSAAGIIDSGIAVGGLATVNAHLDRLLGTLRAGPDGEPDAKADPGPEHDRTYVGDDEPVELEREPVPVG